MGKMTIDERIKKLDDQKKRLETQKQIKALRDTLKKKK